MERKCGRGAVGRQETDVDASLSGNPLKV
jgi:hypothetical protein